MTSVPSLKLYQMTLPLTTLMGLGCGMRAQKMKMMKMVSRKMTDCRIQQAALIDISAIYRLHVVGEIIGCSV